MFDEIRTFPCPKCSAFVSTQKRTCSKCGTEIDPARANELAEQEAFLNAAEADAGHAEYLSSAGLIFYGLVILVVIWFARFEVWQVGTRLARSHSGGLLRFLLALGTAVLFPVLVMASRNLLAWRRKYGGSSISHWRLDDARTRWRRALGSFALLVVLYVVVDVVPAVLYFVRQ